MTTVEFLSGDIFGHLRPGDAIGQGVNCEGVMGHGIAPLFKFRWPDMYTQYRDLCKQRKLMLLGEVFPYRDTLDDILIINLFTQGFKGPNAELPAIQSSVTTAMTICEAFAKPRFLIPAIGSGVGALPWPEVLKVLREVQEGFKQTTITVALL